MVSILDAAPHEPIDIILHESAIYYALRGLATVITISNGYVATL